MGSKTGKRAAQDPIPGSSPIGGIIPGGPGWPIRGGGMCIGVRLPFTTPSGQTEGGATPSENDKKIDVTALWLKMPPKKTTKTCPYPK